MAWEIVTPLEDFRKQLNLVFPDRDKTSDGGIGDTSHAAGKSSHNPDKTGSPEYRDGDSKDEVRARDFDKDLNHPTVTMEMVVQHLVELARAGKLWWIRYIIFNKRIWSASDGWKTRSYSGVNPHDKHAHINGQFTQAADDYAKADYQLEDLVALTAADKTEIKKIVTEALTALLTPTNTPLAAQMKARPWQYQDAGQPTAHSLLIASAGELRTGLRMLPVIRQGVEAVLKKVSDDDADAAKIMEQAAQIAQNDAAARQAELIQSQKQHQELMTALGDVPEEVFEIIQGGSAEQIAVVLDQLLGEKKAAVLAAMNRR